MKNSAHIALVSFAATMLPACQSVAGLTSTLDPNPNPNSIRDQPGSPQSGFESEDASSGEMPAAELRGEVLEYGSARFFEPLSAAESENEAGGPANGRTFVFRDAPIDAVLYQVLGEAFGTNYVLDPNVSARLTLRLDGISSEEEAIAGLGAALRLQGLDISEEGGSYVISNAGQNSEGGGTGSPVFLQSSDILPAGTSLAVLQLKFASVEEVTEIAKSMLPPETIRFSDEARGFVIL